MFCVCTALLSKSYKIPVRTHTRTHAHSIRTRSFIYAHFLSFLSLFLVILPLTFYTPVSHTFPSFFAKSKDPTYARNAFFMIRRYF